MDRSRTGRGVETWSSATWQREAVSWLDEQLAAVGRVRTGTVEQPRIRPWATVLRAPTDAGVVWMKATAATTAFEVGLYRVLADVVPGRVLAPLGADPVRGWILLPDAGVTLGDGDADDVRQAAGLGAALVEYGQLQRDVAPFVDELLAAGVPDMRPVVMVERFAEALDAAAIAVTTAADRDRHGQLAGLTGDVERWCDQLAHSAVPASLDHNDLHPHNVLDDGRVPRRFYDWGDSVVAHPFAVTLVTLSVFRQLLGVGADDPRVISARDAYLREFRAAAPDEDLVETLSVAVRLATIARTLTWDRAVSAAREHSEPIDPEWAAAPLRTLETLLEEPPGRT